METIADFKQGDTRVVPCAYEPVSGPASLAGMQVRASVATASGVAVAALTVRRIDEEAGLFELDFGDTRAWPLGELLADIVYESPSSVTTTDTFRVVVRRRITPLST